MAVSSKQLHRDLKREQRAHRETLAENERLRHLLEVGGPLRGLARAYADVLVASDPVQGRSFDSHHVGEFDRPLPFQQTAAVRAVKEAAERLMRNMTAALVDALGDPADTQVILRDVCSACGQRIDERNRGRRTAVDQARDFITAVLSGGPVEASAVRLAARRYGVSDRTLERSLHGRGAPQVMRYQRDGRWWWELVEGAA